MYTYIYFFLIMNCFFNFIHKNILLLVEFLLFDFLLSIIIQVLKIKNIHYNYLQDKRRQNHLLIIILRKINSYTNNFVEYFFYFYILLFIYLFIFFF